jgi:hypothetical protein
MNELAMLIGELESRISQSEKLNTAVSPASAGWHIEHVLLVTSQIIDAIKKSAPQEYKWQFSLPKIFVFTMNKIPRGKAKAPKSVVPGAPMTATDLKKNVQAVKGKVSELSLLQPNNYFKHPYFGNLNLKATVKMLKIHTRHHLSIIDDIIGSG